MKKTNAPWNQRIGSPQLEATNYSSACAVQTFCFGRKSKIAATGKCKLSPKVMLEAQTSNLPLFMNCSNGK